MEELQRLQTWKVEMEKKDQKKQFSKFLKNMECLDLTPILQLVEHKFGSMRKRGIISDTLSKSQAAKFHKRFLSPEYCETRDDGYLNCEQQHETNEADDHTTHEKLFVTPHIETDSLEQPGSSLPSKYGQLAQPGLSLPSKYGQLAQPELSLPSKYGQLAQPEVSLPSKYGQLAQPEVSLPSKYGQLGQPEVSPPSKYGQLAQPEVSLPSKYGQLGQPEVSLPSKYGQLAQPELSLPSKYGQLAQPEVSLPSKYGQLAQPEVSLPSKYGQLAQPEVSLPSKYGQLAQPELSLPSKYGQLAQPEVSLPSKYGQLGQPEVSPPSKYGQLAQPELSLPSKYEQLAQPEISPPSKYGQLAQPEVSPPSKYGQLAQPEVSLPSKYGSLAQPELSPPSKNGPLAQPELSLPSKYRQLAQPEVSPPSKYGQLAQPCTSPPTEYEQLAQPRASPPSKYGQLAQPRASPPSKYGQLAQPGASPPSEYRQVAASQATWSSFTSDTCAQQSVSLAQCGYSLRGATMSPDGHESHSSVVSSDDDEDVGSSRHCGTPAQTPTDSYRYQSRHRGSVRNEGEQCYQARDDPQTSYHSGEHTMLTHSSGPSKSLSIGREWTSAPQQHLYTPEGFSPVELTALPDQNKSRSMYEEQRTQSYCGVHSQTPQSLQTNHGKYGVIGTPSIDTLPQSSTSDTSCGNAVSCKQHAVHYEGGSHLSGVHSHCENTAAHQPSVPVPSECRHLTHGCTKLATHATQYCTRSGACHHSHARPQCQHCQMGAWHAPFYWGADPEDYLPVKRTRTQICDYFNILDVASDVQSQWYCSLHQAYREAMTDCHYMYEQAQRYHCCEALEPSNRRKRKQTFQVRDYAQCTVQEDPYVFDTDIYKHSRT